jgi:hypothetical protein
MNILKSILTFFLLLIIVSSAVQASTIVSGTSVTKRISEKYSLKNLSSLSHKTSTFRDLKSSLLYKGLSVSMTSSNTNLGQTSYLKYNKGNITYVIPYRHKVILPRFKTPSPQHP